MSLHVSAEMEPRRIRSGPMASSWVMGANGAFRVRCPGRGELFLVVSDGTGWEHISVSTENRCPVWEEMEWVKRRFWDEGDTVMQFHVPLRDHVNVHPFCLHLLRPAKGEPPRPPSWMVGPKDLSSSETKGRKSSCDS